MLGANGVGKSSLVSLIYRTHTSNAKRISAHRQTWFTSNSIDLTPKSRDDVATRIVSHDSQTQARFQLNYGAERTSIAIYDLLSAQSSLDRKIAAYVREGKLNEAEKEGKSPSPLQVINNLLVLSNIPIRISVTDQDHVVASKNGSPDYSIAELSDGERNALLMAADVLTAKPDTLLIIDEPERHLHRSIISPLLASLFSQRSDCTFIVSTHEVMLPIDTPKASTLLVRDCEYQGGSVSSWTLDMVGPGVGVDDELKADILGARRKILFIEGTHASLDVRIYNLIFPSITVIPKNGCRDVENSVIGLRGVEDMSWVSAWGIIDLDQRTNEKVEKLKRTKIFALPHYSVEALYYLPTVVRAVANRQAEVQGFDPEIATETGIASAVEAIKQKKEDLILRSVERTIRNDIQGKIPVRDDLKARVTIQVIADVSAAWDKETLEFEAMTNSKDWDAILQRYPVRMSAALDRISGALKFASRSDYEGAVLKLLADDPVLLMALRRLFGDLYEQVTGIKLVEEPEKSQGSEQLAGADATV